MDLLVPHVHISHHNLVVRTELVGASTQGKPYGYPD